MLDCTCKLYTYADNSDQLLSYGEEAFEYDVIGNPTTYRGKSATWANGRQLTSFDGNTFTYDARGRRISKQKESETAIIFTYDNSGNLIKQSNGLEFLYDHTGVFAVKQGNSTYYYRKNAQNDIIALLDSNGDIVVKYRYDAWGKCQTTVLTSAASTIAELNPFRYRSYYYDIGIGLYFLKTRYYDPEIGRFMTIDDLSYLDPESINGLNLYAYCLNNPVNCVDPNGTFVLTTAILIGLIAGAVIGGTVGGIYAYNQASAAGATGWSLVGQTLLGVLGGGLIGAAIGGIVGYAAPFISAFLSTSFPILMPVNLGGVIGYTVVATVTGAQIVGGAAVVAGAGLLMFARTPKSGGYYGERWPGDPHKPDHVHLRGNKTDIRIGRDGNPLPGEKPLDSQARKALEKLWGEFLKLFNKW